MTGLKCSPCQTCIGHPVILVACMEGANKTSAVCNNLQTLLSQATDTTVTSVSRRREVRLGPHDVFTGFIHCMARIKLECIQPFSL